jgi:hypothetical protein
MPPRSSLQVKGSLALWFKLIVGASSRRTTADSHPRSCWEFVFVVPSTRTAIPPATRRVFRRTCSSACRTSSTAAATNSQASQAHPQRPRIAPCFAGICQEGQRPLPPDQNARRCSQATLRPADRAYLPAPQESDGPRLLFVVVALQAVGGCQTRFESVYALVT